MRIAPPRHWDTAGSPGSGFGTLADEYLVATRDAGVTKALHKDYELHHDPAILQLAADAPLHLEDRPRVVLPPPLAVAMPLAEAVVQRSSGRDFGPRSLTAEQLASLLYLGNGVRPVVDGGAEFTAHRRNAANAGGLGSVEIFPIVLNVAGVAPGVYHFDSVRHDLARLHGGEFRSWLRERVLHQVEFAEAAVALVLTSAFGRLRAKYGERCLRFGFLDAGHVSENIYLVGTGLGLRVCATAGFVDDALDRALGLDGLEVAPVLVLLVGTSG
jgi:SagB-type dehydrogenase family enzyme